MHADVSRLDPGRRLHRARRDGRGSGGGGECRTRLLAAPGAYNPAVTQANIDRTANTPEFHLRSDVDRGWITTVQRSLT